MNQSAFVAMPEQPSPSSPQKNDQELTPDSTDNTKSDYDRMTRSITAVGAATYHWSIETDEIVWHGDTGQIFNHIDPANFANGRSYASLLDPDNFTSRFETVMRTHHNDDGNGVAFSIEYSIKPFGRDQEQSIWIEDTGRWYAGPDGRPREVFGVVRQIDDRHEQDQHLQFMSNCDPLTGMLNRGRLAEALGETIELAKTEGHCSGFLIVSVSNLAIVNDAYGFDVADDVIIKVGRRLREVVRTGDVIGRCSGSKFGIILSRASKEEIVVAAERFLTIARQKVIETEMGPVWAILSIGAVILPNENEGANKTMAHAEEALTEATRLPTDAVVVYQPSPDLVSERQLNSRCAIEIVHSLKENQFTLAYQPVVNAATKEVEFYEALLRMKSEDGDLIAAGHLVPISEKLGLIRLIDQLVVNKVITTLRQFPQAKIAMNLSGVTANDPRWVGKLIETLEENRDVTERLTVEITETVVLKDIEHTVEFIKKLHTLGCKVAIDDFGAGFTSFKNLQLLNVDKVKIDGSFCQNLSNSQDNQFFVHTLIELSKKFDLEIVAEWVENEEDAALLSSWGVNYLQGRLYGMAESQSPWGDPAEDPGEVCVVPSEILIRDDDEHDQETAVPTSQLIFDGTLAAEKDDDQERRREPTAPEPDPIAQPFEVQSTSADLASNLTGDPVMQIPALEIETARRTEDRDKGTANQLDLEITKLRQAIAMINSSQAAG
ncbi:diguanylate cyclase/phosphodiesterase (GGDEF & EAL domains) with PAS/PAC sensor(s) [hydrothermal vent metagenome]|uniref:Diguanylate cyclase/phosphodiesterase (GGDEF & EAL domains) with PAS/PAC sensor(S) n=1 Tax=hydrothermal vent metagenome TaxID=652676 RepID=A0A3B0RM87_9ZZZZ